MFENKRNIKKCDIRFQVISMYLKLARLQRIKRDDYSTVKVCNLVFLCVGSNSYRYIHHSNIAFFARGRNIQSSLLFILGMMTSEVSVVGSFWKGEASPRWVFKCPVHKPSLIPKIQNTIKLNRNLIRGKPNMVNTTGVWSVLSQMMQSDTAYTNPTLKFLN